MKYCLYSSLTDWNNKNASLESYLGIPYGTQTLSYAAVSQVTNAENANFGKYILPVETEGMWKCDDQFSEGDLIDYDATWYPDVHSQVPEQPNI